MNSNWVEFIIKLGSIAGSVTIVMKFSVDTYKKLITDPYNKKALEMQSENGRMLQDALLPLTHAIDSLNDLLADSKNDRVLLHQKNEKQDDKIKCVEKDVTTIGGRVLVLEDWKNNHKH